MESNDLASDRGLEVPASPGVSSLRHPHRGIGPESAAVWSYPGLEQNTFYAFAYYIHKTQRTLAAPWLDGHPQTNEVTRVFLDRLADCFAWTKRPGETAGHVTATAILNGDLDHSPTILIAKNILHEEQEAAFAEKFFSWLNSSPETPVVPDEGMSGDNKDVKFWEFLVNSNTNRLVHYITQVREASAKIPEERRDQVEWDLVNEVIRRCKEYNTEANLFQELSECAVSALEARRDVFFRTLCNTLQFRRERDRKENPLSGYFSYLPHEEITGGKLLEGIDYLGRLRSSYEYFIKFRDAEKGTRFEHRIIRADEAKWDGVASKAKLTAWTGFMPGVDKMKQSIDDAVGKYGDRGSVHCEMQLLYYFIHHDIAFPDYLGCSKKACALCQHVLASCKVHANGQHNFLYPRWSLPAADFKERTHLIAAGLMSAYASMQSVIQESVRLVKSPERDQGVIHTSARATRRVSFRNPDDIGINHLNPRVKRYSVPDRQSLGSVPAIHFPRGERADPRVVRMDLYERNKNDIFERSMEAEHFSGRSAVTAIQLRDKFTPSKTAYKLEGFAKCQWLSIWIPEFLRPSAMVMLHRISREFEENVCLRDVLDRNEKLKPKGTIVPQIRSPDERNYLRGDIFVLPCSNDSGHYEFVDREINLRSSVQKLGWDDLYVPEGNASLVMYESLASRWKEAVEGIEQERATVERIKQESATMEWIKQESATIESMKRTIEAKHGPLYDV
ncbi:hypothetical protein F5Y05DRAFT_203440 [Hypoxylon sp. FL0543]|nr:hypothetical protein F5Y05DRAFT_203440 [Hypoxylon sp. FL0543]